LEDARFDSLKTRHHLVDVAGQTREAEDTPVVAADPTVAAEAVRAVVAGSVVAAVQRPLRRIVVADLQVVTESPNAVVRAAEAGHGEVGRAAVASRGVALRAAGAAADAADLEVAESRSAVVAVTGDLEVEKRSRERVGAVIKQLRADREVPKRERKVARAATMESRSQRNARAVRRALPSIKTNVVRVVVLLEEKFHQSVMVVLTA